MGRRRARGPRFVLHHEACQALVSVISKASTRRLKRASEQCGQMTTTNVWWVPYDARGFLSELIDIELKHRAFTKANPRLKGVADG